MSDFFERCWFIYGLRINQTFLGFVIKHSRGGIAGVKFDWEKIYDSKFLIGFFHTHPDNILGYSAIDDKTMKGWVNCLWRDLICGIWNENRDKNTCYLFQKDKTIKKIKCLSSKIIFIGKE